MQSETHIFFFGLIHFRLTKNSDNHTCVLIHQLNMYTFCFIFVHCIHDIYIIHNICFNSSTCIHFVSYTVKPAQNQTPNKCINQTFNNVDMSEFFVNLNQLMN
jgi:hypothetical protein